MSTVKNDPTRGIPPAWRELTAGQWVDILLGRAPLPDAAPVPSPPRAGVPAASLERWQATLPSGQFRAVEALVGGGRARTYAVAAKAAGVSVNTLKTQLRRVRLRAPAVWDEVCRVRAGQLAQRHRAAVARAEQRSRAWHRRQANRRYYQRFGRWPWE